MNCSLKILIHFLTLANKHIRRFSGGLDGLGFSEFVILFHLHQLGERKMRRGDLAEKLGLTPAGVTKILGPMEKIGLIRRESTPHDARVSYVVLTESGERNVTESMSRAVELAEKMFPPQKIAQYPGLEDMLFDLGGSGA